MLDIFASLGKFFIGSIGRPFNCNEMTLEEPINTVKSLTNFNSSASSFKDSSRTSGFAAPESKTMRKTDFSSVVSFKFLPLEVCMYVHWVESNKLITMILGSPDLLTWLPFAEDCVNDKKPRGRDGENTISTAALVSIIEDSMRVFREFLQTDKDKCGKVQLHYNPFDAQMMMEIRTGLRKVQIKTNLVVFSFKVVTILMDWVDSLRRSLENTILRC